MNFKNLELAEIWHIFWSLKLNIHSILSEYIPQRLFFHGGGGNQYSNPYSRGASMLGGISKAGDLNGMGVTGKMGGKEEEVHTTS